VGGQKVGEGGNNVVAQGRRVAYNQDIVEVDKNEKAEGEQR
jgi:hypothetical protein